MPWRVGRTEQLGENESAGRLPAGWWGMTWRVGQCRHEDRSREATTKYTPLTRGNRLLTQEHTNGGCSSSGLLHLKDVDTCLPTVHITQ